MQPVQPLDDHASDSEPIKGRRRNVMKTQCAALSGSYTMAQLFVSGHILPGLAYWRLVPRVPAPTNYLLHSFLDKSFMISRFFTLLINTAIY